MCFSTSKTIEFSAIVMRFQCLSTGLRIQFRFMWTYVFKLSPGEINRRRPANVKQKNAELYRKTNIALHPIKRINLHTKHRKKLFVGNLPVSVMGLHGFYFFDFIFIWTQFYYSFVCIVVHLQNARHFVLTL